VNTDTEVSSIDSFILDQTQKKNNLMSLLNISKTDEAYKKGVYEISKSKSRDEQNAAYQAYIKAKSIRVYQEEEQTYMNDLITLAKEKLDVAKKTAQDYFDSQKILDDALIDENNIKKKLSIARNNRDRLIPQINAQPSIVEKERLAKETIDKEVNDLIGKIATWEKIRDDPNSSSYSIEMAKAQLTAARTNLNNKKNTQADITTSYNNALSAKKKLDDEYRRLDDILIGVQSELDFKLSENANKRKDAIDKRNNAAIALYTAKKAADVREDVLSQFIARAKSAGKIVELEVARQLSDAKSTDTINALNSQLEIAKKDAADNLKKYNDTNDLLTKKQGELNVALQNISLINKQIADAEKLKADTDANLLAAQGDKNSIQTILNNALKDSQTAAIELGKAQARAQSLQENVNYYQNTIMPQLLTAQNEAKTATALKAEADRRLADAQASLITLQASTKASETTSNTAATALAEAQTKLDQALREKDEAQRQLTNRLLEYSILSNDRTNAENNIKRLTDENARLLATANQQKADADAKIADLQSQKATVDGKVKDLENTNKISQSTILKLQGDKDAETSRANQIAADKIRVENELSRLKAEKEANDILIKQLNNEISLQKSKIKILEEEVAIERKNTTLAYLENTLLQQQKKLIENEKARLEKVIKEEQIATQDKIKKLKDVYGEEQRDLILKEQIRLQKIIDDEKALAASKISKLQSVMAEEQMKTISKINEMRSLYNQEQEKANKRITDLIDTISNDKNINEKKLSDLSKEKANVEALARKLQEERNAFEDKAKLLMESVNEFGTLTFADVEKMKNDKIEAEKRNKILSKQKEDADRAAQIAKEAATAKDKQIASLLAEKAAAEKAIEIAQYNENLALEEKTNAQKKITDLTKKMRESINNLNTVKDASQSITTQQNMLSNVKDAQNNPNLSQSELDNLKQRQLKIEDLLIKKSNEFDELQKKAREDSSNFNLLKLELDEAKRRADEAQQKLYMSQNIKTSARKIISEKDQISPEQLMIIQEDSLRPRRPETIDKNAVYIVNGEIGPQSSVNLLKTLLKDSIGQKDKLNADDAKIINDLLNQFAPEVQKAIDSKYTSTLVDRVRNKTMAEEMFVRGEERDIKYRRLENELRQQKQFNDKMCKNMQPLEETVMRKVIDENEKLRIQVDKIKEVVPGGNDLFQTNVNIKDYIKSTGVVEENKELERRLEENKRLEKRLEESKTKNVLDEEILNKVRNENILLKKELNSLKNSKDLGNKNYIMEDPNYTVSVKYNNDGDSNNLEWDSYIDNYIDNIQLRRNNDLFEYFFNRYS